MSAGPSDAFRRAANRHQRKTGKPLTDYGANVIDAYFDRQTLKTWVARRVDPNGNQVGDCAYGHTRRAAVQTLEEKERQQ